ncbi:MAG: chorismate synthase [Acidimicrobiia bacterium]|nr:chorismate synthase [bacterium]MXX44995.1 chorismate synthase [Acidimicrobiia bacterium]MDE0675380.1 chorismate synthase [bacterium]MXY73995.1 chorismate synthase [Acidimicrobiia bacterium]MYA40000.1 chorismate synthase [Acidimicrobiia bacterium]
MLRFLTAGESHGPGLVTIVEGVPAGLAFSAEDLAGELARRRMGYGRGNRMKLERDELEIMGGVRHGYSLGSPVAVIIRNTEWAKWEEEMSPFGGREPRRRMTTPRPGHADLAGMIKYNTHDARNILERASARETAARTVVGYLCKVLLATLDVSVFSHVVTIGEASAPDHPLPVPSDLKTIDQSPVRVFHSQAEAAMVDEIEAAKADRNTLGGVVEVLAYGLPPGIGSHVHWDRKLDGLLAGALMSIHAIKGVEIGDGLRSAARRGAVAHDEIFYEDEEGYFRETNRAGGTEGGITLGGILRVRAAMKPISTVMRPLNTVDVDTRQPQKAFRERSDVCAVPAAGVVAEQMVAFVLAREAQRMVGGDTVEDLMAGWRSHWRKVEQF